MKIKIMRSRKSRKKKNKFTGILGHPINFARDLNESTGGILRDIGLISIPFFIKDYMDNKNNKIKEELTKKEKEELSRKEEEMRRINLIKEIKKNKLKIDSMKPNDKLRIDMISLKYDLESMLKEYGLYQSHGNINDKKRVEMIGKDISGIRSQIISPRGESEEPIDGDDDIETLPDISNSPSPEEVHNFGRRSRKKKKNRKSNKN